MKIVDIIIKKRDKKELSSEEIKFFVEEFAVGNVPDYQASAWAMAVLLNGMTPRETTNLTIAMANSGDTLDLSGIVDIAVDKHSTGGVGDKTTLVVQPLVAACGLPVGKMSGRGLGFSGGTLDKMESIPGFRVDLNTEEFKKQLKEIGLVLTGQTGDLAPADGKMYSLRDVTGTVPSMPLIASSIMSKKIAAGAQRIVLDVKIGMGAFMETEEEARILAESMVLSAELAGRKAVALLSNMDQPLGIAVGNSLEVIEAIETLKGGGPEDFLEHSLEVAAYMLYICDRAESVEAGKSMAEKAISDGSGWEMFRKLVIAQGGDVSYIDHPEKLPKAKFIQDFRSQKDGYVKEINAQVVGKISVELGAGREKKGDSIDHAVGIMIYKNVGDYVKKGDLLFTIHANQEEKLAPVTMAILRAHTLSQIHVEPIPLFYGVID